MISNTKEMNPISNINISIPINNEFRLSGVGANLKLKKKFRTIWVDLQEGGLRVWLQLELLLLDIIFGELQQIQVTRVSKSLRISKSKCFQKFNWNQHLIYLFIYFELNIKNIKTSRNAIRFFIIFKSHFSWSFKVREVSWVTFLNFF